MHGQEAQVQRVITSPPPMTQSRRARSAHRTVSFFKAPFEAASAEFVMYFNLKERRLPGPLLIDLVPQSTQHAWSQATIPKSAPGTSQIILINGREGKAGIIPAVVGA